ncbi:MAG TPA: hypothetical protein VKS60_00360 [Stellaceae bacterium]|nr:hypothetical protein [Stellaceae bacterium]
MPPESVRLEFACFSVSAAAEPGTLHRLLEPFAKRGLVPSALHARVIGDSLRADLQVEMAPELAASVAETLRQMPSVERVLVAALQEGRVAR